MVKIKKSSDELNSFLSRVYISPEHAASFTGSDKLYHKLYQILWMKVLQCSIEVSFMVGGFLLVSHLIKRR